MRLQVRGSALTCDSICLQARGVGRGALRLRRGAHGRERWRQRTAARRAQHGLDVNGRTSLPLRLGPRHGLDGNSTSLSVGAVLTGERQEGLLEAAAARAQLGQQRRPGSASQASARRFARAWARRAGPACRRFRVRRRSARSPSAAATSASVTAGCVTKRISCATERRRPAGVVQRHQAAVVDDGHAIGELLGFVHEVRRQQDGRAARRAASG